MTMTLSGKAHTENRIANLPIAEEGESPLELAVHDWYCEEIPKYDSGATSLVVSRAVQDCVDELWAAAVAAKSTAALTIKLRTHAQIRKIIAETSGTLQRGSNYGSELDHYHPTIVGSARTIVAYARPQLFADAIRSIIDTAGRELVSAALHVTQTSPLTFRVTPVDNGMRFNITGLAPSIGKAFHAKPTRAAKYDML